MIKLYLLDITRPFDTEICKKDFPERFEHSEKFRFEEDKLRCKAGAALLSGVLHLTEADLKYTSQSKPYSDSISECFNLSHSKNYCVLAVSDGEVGVDIESKEKKHRISVSGRFLCDDELEYISESEDRFFDVWTMKESVSKLIGKGLAMSFNSFSVIPLLCGECALIEGRSLFGKSVPLEGYSLSVCADTECEDVSVIFVN